MEKNLQQRETDCLRIVLYGPESTGKTTLAKSLANVYNTTWVQEFARKYLQDKWDKKKEVCNLKDLLIIAKGQLELENKAVEKAKKFVFCDTNILVTKVWSETHFDGYCPPEIQSCVDIFQYEHYFLTSIDIPWKADDLRDQPNNRQEMFFHYKKLLEKKKLSFTILKGTHNERMYQAQKTLTEIKHKNDF